MPRVALHPLMILLLTLSPAAAADDTDSSFPPYDRSLAMARKEVERHPGNPRFVDILARVHSRASRFGEAAIAFEAAMKAHPKDFLLVAGLGEIYLKQERLESAEKTLQHAISLASGVSDRAANSVRPVLARAFQRAGRFREAAGELRTVVAGGGGNATTLYELGLALDSLSRQLGKAGDTAGHRASSAEARSCLERSIALGPEQAEAHYMLGRLFMRTGERERGRKSLETFRKLRKARRGPSEASLSRSNAKFEAETAYNLARLLLKVKDPNAALAYTTRALQAYPGHESTLALRGWIYMQGKRPVDAVRAYQELLKKRPDQAVAHWNLGKLHLSAGRTRDAEKHFLRAVDSHATADHWEFLFKLSSSGKAFVGRSSEFARRALEMRPSPPNYVAYAMCLQDAGESAGCERVLREGLKRFPRNPALLRGLAALRKSP